MGPHDDPRQTGIDRFGEQIATDQRAPDTLLPDVLGRIAALDSYLPSLWHTPDVPVPWRSMRWAGNRARRQARR